MQPDAGCDLLSDLFFEILATTRRTDSRCSRSCDLLSDCSLRYLLQRQCRLLHVQAVLWFAFRLFFEIFAYNSDSRLHGPSNQLLICFQIVLWDICYNRSSLQTGPCGLKSCDLLSDCSFRYLLQLACPHPFCLLLLVVICFQIVLWDICYNPK